MNARVVGATAWATGSSGEFAASIDAHAYPSRSSYDHQKRAGGLAVELTYGKTSDILCHMAALLHPPSSRVALAAFGKLADRWALDQGQRALLLGRSERTAYRLSSAVRADRPLQRDTLERISLLVGIYEDTRAVFGSGAAADGWIRRPNGDFGGEAPLDRLLAGNVQDIIEVRRYLALARQGW